MKTVPNSWGAVIVGIVITWFACFAGVRANATELDLIGHVSFRPSANEHYVLLEAEELANLNFGGISGTIRLELWAFATPFTGTQSGYRLASTQLGELYGGESFVNIYTGFIPFVRPPPGRWYFALLAREFVGAPGDGFVTRDHVNFPAQVRVAGAALRGDVDLSGHTSWVIDDDRVIIRAERIKNVCDLGVTAALRVDLWATSSPYVSGAISGYRFGSVVLYALSAGASYQDLVQVARYIRPPDGYYYVTMTVSEYHDGQYRLLDHVTYSGRRTFGNPPPPVPSTPTGLAASKGSLTTGVRLTWTASAHATTYEVYRSTGNSAAGSTQIKTGVTGTSYLDTSARVGTTYFYWVKARNVSGQSGFSTGDYGVRSGAPPTIISQPKSLNRLIGQSASFAVLVNGTGPFAYQWRKDGGDIPGQTGPSLTLGTVDSNSAGAYSVVVSNGYGVVTTVSAKLTVFDPATLKHLYWQFPDRRLAAWYTSGTNLVLTTVMRGNNPIPEGWTVNAFGDLNADEKADMILQHTDGRMMGWLLDGSTVTATVTLQKPAVGWRLVGAAHMDADTQSDLLLRHKDGRLAVWHMDGTTRVTGTTLFDNKPVDNAFRFIDAADFNGDGHSDLVWHHTNGRVFIWVMEGTSLRGKLMLRNGTPNPMRLAAITDLDEDGHPDLLWQAADQKIYMWKMERTEFVKNVLLNKGKPAALGWKMLGPK